MASVAVKPLPPVGSLLLRRNPTTTPFSKSPAMLTAGSSRHFLGSSRCFDSLRQMKISTYLNNRRRVSTVVASAGNLTASSWDSWKPDKTAAATAVSLSDVIWPAAGAFAAMAIMGRIDQMQSPKGVSMSVAPLGAVSAILFTTPSAPAARKYNMFLAQIGCAAIGVVAFSVCGPGWLARSVALAASIAFMVIARANHPPAASLPLMFIDGAKFHHLNLWYALFPGAAACVILCLIKAFYEEMECGCCRLAVVVVAQKLYTQSHGASFTKVQKLVLFTYQPVWFFSNRFNLLVMPIAPETLENQLMGINFAT